MPIILRIKTQEKCPDLETRLGSQLCLTTHGKKGNCHGGLKVGHVHCWMNLTLWFQPKHRVKGVSTGRRSASP